MEFKSYRTFITGSHISDGFKNFQRRAWARSILDPPSKSARWSEACFLTRCYHVSFYMNFIPKENLRVIFCSILCWLWYVLYSKAQRLGSKLDHHPCLAKIWIQIKFSSFIRSTVSQGLFVVRVINYFSLLDWLIGLAVFCNSTHISNCLQPKRHLVRCHNL